MKRGFLFISIILLGMLVLGCADTREINELEGFQIIKDSSILDEDVTDWIHEISSSTGLYRNTFSSGNYLLITFGDHNNYLIKKMDITEDLHGFIFNITVHESDHEGPWNTGFLTSPILVKTDHVDVNYDVRIIYR